MAILKDNEYYKITCLWIVNHRRGIPGGSLTGPVLRISLDSFRSAEEFELGGPATRESSSYVIPEEFVDLSKGDLRGQAYKYLMTLPKFSGGIQG